MERNPHSALPVIGIDRDAAQKLHLLALHIHAGDQRLQIGRIVLAVHLGLECAFVGCVLVFVDGVAHHPQVVAQLALVLALDLKARNGHGRRGQDGKNRHGDNQLDQRQAPLPARSIRDGAGLEPDFVGLNSSALLPT